MDVKIPPSWFAKKKKEKAQENAMKDEQEGQSQVQIIVADFHGDFSIFGSK